MKKLVYLLLFAVSGVTGGSAYAQTPADFCMAVPVGYGRNATGGAGGKVVTVASHTELKNALKAAEKSIIIITQNITFGEGAMISEIIKDKTLLGLKGVKLVSTAQTKNGGILGLKAGSTNVIIRNLIFEGPGAYDVDGNDLLSNMGCLNLWVDHCEFYDGVDGNFDNTNSADNISVSW
jgi:pectate lyase